MSWINNSVLNSNRSPAIQTGTLAQMNALGYNLDGMLFVTQDTQALYSNNGAGFLLIGGPGTGTITGSGTAGKITKFTSASVIGDSIMSEAGTVVTIAGSMLANGYATPGGLSTQFLKADGSLDSNTYLTTSAAGLAYVPYAGANANVDLGTKTISSYQAILTAPDLTAFIKSNDIDFINLIENDTIRLQGTTLNNVGYIRFGNTDTNKLGYDGTKLVYGNFSISSAANVTAAKYIVTGGLSTQFLKADGTLDSNTYLTTISGIAAGGELSGTYVNPTLVNSAVIGKVLTGYVSGAGVVAATDTILQAIQKLNGNTAVIATGYVPYTGATGAVNLGAFDLTVNGLTVGKGVGNAANSTAVGVGALGAVNVSSATAFGNNALNVLTSGLYETAVGDRALSKNTIGNGNTAVGFSAMRENISGSNNTVLGASVMPLNTAGSQNTVIGYRCAFSHTTMANSILIGFATQFGQTTGDGNVIIGNIDLGNVSDTIAIGSGAAATTRIKYDGSSWNLYSRVNVNNAVDGASYQLNVNGAAAINGNIDLGQASGNYNLRIKAGAAGLARIIAASASDLGYIDYDIANNSWILRTNSIAALTLNSSQVGSFASRVNVNGATDNVLYTLNVNGTLNVSGFTSIMGNIDLGQASGNYNLRIKAGAAGLARIIAASASDLGYIDYDIANNSWILRTNGTAGYTLNASQVSTFASRINVNGAVDSATYSINTIGGINNTTGDNYFNSTSGATSIGTATNTYKLNVAGGIYDSDTQSTLNQSKFGVFGGMTSTVTGTETNQYLNAGIGAAYVFNGTGTYTPYASAKNGAVSATYFITNTGTVSGIGQTYFSSVELSSSGSATTLAAYRVATPQQYGGGSAYTGTVTNMCGVYIDDISSSSIAARFTNKYAIYQVGTSDKNFFGGEIILGAGQVVSASTTNTNTNKIKMIVNGTTYYLLASTSST